jgi:hypothetical protein
VYCWRLTLSECSTSAALAFQHHKNFVPWRGFMPDNHHQLVQNACAAPI